MQVDHIAGKYMSNLAKLMDGETLPRDCIFANQWSISRQVSQVCHFISYSNLPQVPPMTEWEHRS